METFILIVAIVGLVSVTILPIIVCNIICKAQKSNKPVKKYTLLCDVCNNIVTVEGAIELEDDDYICPTCESYMELESVKYVPKNDNYGKYTYDYPMPAVTSDAVIFNYIDGKQYVLLIKRKNEPYAGMWALPGGYVECNETILDCVYREVFEETGIDLLTEACVSCENVNIYDHPDRDPRGRTISVSSHFILEPEYADDILAGDDADEIDWFDVNDLPPLAFDHDTIINDAIMNDLLNQWRNYQINTNKTKNE